MASTGLQPGAELDAELESHRRALTVHCYRFLGSLHDAEEAVQETYLRAWRARSGFRGDASLRTWLLRIATRVCLDLRDSRRRRITPVAAGPAAEPDASPASAATDIAWLEPIPGEHLDGASLDPASLYTLAESVKLAFVAALQTLPPRQRAVLLLRDVLAWSAAETADALGMSVGAANSALHRARQRLAATHHASGIDAVRAADPDDPGIVRLLDAYVRAWQRDDVDALVEVLRDDVRIAMPPSPAWYDGRDDVVGFLRSAVFPRGTYRLAPTTANAQPAYRMWLREADDGAERSIGLQVLTIVGDAIASIDVFLELDP